MILFNRTSLSAFTLAAAFAIAPASAFAAPPKVAPAAQAKAPSQLQGDKRLTHALNRFAFGPRPGDIERVREMGIGKWIEAQLAPETLADAAVEAKLSRLPTLRYTSEQLALAYAYDTRNALQLLRKNREQGDMTARTGRPAAAPILAPQLTAADEATLKRVQEMDMLPQTSQQSVGELSNAKLVRAVESNRQLQEVLVDFWNNHFNVDVRKNSVRTLKIADDRDVIRPHVLGRFRDLLGASAKSPAMLVYLDNARSRRPMEPRQRLRPALNANGQIPRPRMGGINENYARELMELHTLGVDGGYSQTDVIEVARCLTGWSVDAESGEFWFRPNWHDEGEKTVLGQKIPAGGGQKDGEMVLDILARHPKTAQRIAHKLCVRLVADNPPAALVERAAREFLKTNGDLKAVVRLIAYAPETYGADVYRAKIKSPFEFAVSSVRALGGTLNVPRGNEPIERLRLVADGVASVGRVQPGRYKMSLAQQVSVMGQPLWGFQAPTGYPEDSSKWVSSGALISRLNFALALTGDRVANVDVPADLLPQDINNREAMLKFLSARVGGDLSPMTRAILEREMPIGQTPDARQLVALVLGSPEFQRR